MLVIGIDPGVAVTGYGLVRESSSGDLELVAYGALETDPACALPQRLSELHRRLRELVEHWQPQQAAVESIFFATNAKSAISVGQARGVALMTLFEAGLTIAEYTPLQVKQAVAGYGSADKRQVQEMVRLLLHLAELPRPDDAADALAIAITHLHQQRWA